MGFTLVGYSNLYVSRSVFVHARVGGIIRAENHVAADTVFIERPGQHLCIGVHAVIDFHLPFVEHYAVVLTEVAVAIVVIVLVRVDIEGVFAFGEDRFSEEVCVGAVFLGKCYRLGFRLSVPSLHSDTLDAEIAHLHAVKALYGRYGDGAMVDMSEGVVEGDLRAACVVFVIFVVYVVFIVRCT